MSRHIVIATLMLASATSAIGAQPGTALDTSSASNVKNEASTSDVTNASDARSASGERARSKSDAAAKRQAKTAAKASDDVTKAAEAKGDSAKAEGDTAAKADAAASKDEVKTLSGISILGNQEAPKSLVIVPWKSSEIGDMPGLSRLLDDAVQPIDKEVFMRELDYYEIRSSSR